MTFDATERETTKRAFAAILSEAPPAPEFRDLGSAVAVRPAAPHPIRKPLTITVAAALVAVVAIGVPLLLRDGSGGAPGRQTEAGVIAQVDTDGPSCDSIADPIRLVDLFGINDQWFLATPSDVVSLETGRRRQPQALVVVEGLADVATRLNEFAGMARRPITIREDRFAALEATTEVGGSLYIQVFRVDEEESAAKALVWIDSAGDVHFLGNCALRLWTEPFRALAEVIGWPGDQESLLRDLIADGPTRQQLADWSYGEPIAPQGYGTVTGALRAQGGRAPGIDVLTAGKITIWRDETVFHTLDVDGEFAIHLPAGEYRLTSTFANDIDRCSEETVTVGAGQVTDVVITCAMR